MKLSRGNLNNGAPGRVCEDPLKAIYCLLAATTLAIADPSLQGTVSDPSGAAVSQARVTLKGAAIHTIVTSIDGRYRFPSLRPGTYQIEAEALGFGASQPHTVEVTPAGAHRDIRLDLAKVTSQIQVTANGAPQSIDEQAKALSIITAGQIESRAEFSIPEAIRQTPGIRVQQLGGPGSFTRILTRGLRAQDTSILIDGFRLRDAASPQGDASAFLGDLLVAGMDRIEVLRGSGSSLYGTHATGGVVNVITDSSSGGRFHGGLTTEGGGLGLFRGLAKVSGGAMGDRLRYFGATTHLNVTKGTDGNDRARNSLGHGSMQYQLGPATLLGVRLLGSRGYTQLNTSPSASPDFTTFNPSADDPDSSRNSHYFSGLLSLRHDFSSNLNLSGNYQAVTTSRDNRNGPGGPGFQPLFNASDRFEGRIDTVQLRSDAALGRWQRLTGGYEFEKDTLSSTSISLGVDASAGIAQRSHSAFIQDQIQLLDRRLLISISGRLQSFTLNRPRFQGGANLYSGAPLNNLPSARTGDLSVAYLLGSTGTKVRAHIGNGYRAPALYERFGSSFFFGSFSAYGDPNLKPDRLLAFDGGIDQYLANSKVRISATYFYTRIQEAIFFDFSGAISPATDPYGRFGGYRNTGGGLARGVELGVEANPYRSLTVHSSYTFTNADERRSALLNGSLRSYRVSDHMFTATASQRIGRNIDVSFDLFAASGYTFPFSGRAFVFPGPRKADAAASYTRPLSDHHSLRFFTRIENVLNRTYFEEGFRTPGRWATAGVKFLF